LRCPKVIPIAWLLLFAPAPPLLDHLVMYLWRRRLQLRAVKMALLLAKNADVNAADK
jgi:hypothetical protein